MAQATKVSMKEDSLFFFLFFCYIEISQEMVALDSLLVPMESPWLVQVHQASFIMFWPPMKKLLNIEQNFIENLLNVEQNFIENLFTSEQKV